MAEGAPLLREYTLIAYRGFESLLLRHPNVSAPIKGAFSFGRLGRDENLRFRPNAKRLVPSREGGEARRGKTAQRLFWVIPPSPPSIKSPLRAGFFICQRVAPSFTARIGLCLCEVFERE